MNVFHHSILLYKVNQIQREITKRNSGEELPERQGPALENLDNAKSIANSLFKQVCFHINRHIKELDIQSLQTTLQSIAQGVDVDKSELSKASLEEIEKKVL